jgi:Xaa-Pro dipeptidase
VCVISSERKIFDLPVREKGTMSLHFSSEEFSRRRTALLRAMQREKLDAIFLFQQESMYWLTGYDTFGFCFFQCLVVKADGRTALLTRSADLRQAHHTSNIQDIHVWKDQADANPTIDLKLMARAFGLAGKRIGAEFESYGLVHSNGRKLEAAFNGFAFLIDASSVVNTLRVVKSAEELAFVHQAGKLSDLADRAAIEAICAGADEGAILAVQQGAIFVAGGDYPANEFIIGSGRDALLCRYKSGRRKLLAQDQITLEFAGVCHHYHAAAMRTHVVGQPKPLHLAYHRAAKEALLACEDELRPGRTAGAIFAAHARIFADHGLTRHRLNACGYSLGAKFTPSWMDQPMFYEANETVLQPGMVMFIHMILMDSETETAMCLGRSSVVTQTIPTVLNIPDLDLVIR